MSIVHSWYQRRIWRDKLRPAVLRKHPLCAKCGERTGKPSTHADHIIPFKFGKNETEQWAMFTDLDGNLQGLCFECHSSKVENEEKSRKGTIGQRMAQAQPLGGVEQTAMCGSVPVKFFTSSLTPAQLDHALDHAWTAEGLGIDEKKLSPAQRKANAELDAFIEGKTDKVPQ